MNIRSNSQLLVYIILALSLLPIAAVAQPSFRNELLDLRLGGTVYAGGVSEGFYAFKDKMAEFRLSRDTDGRQEAWLHFAAGELNPTGEEIREGFIISADRDNRSESEKESTGMDAALYASIKGRFCKGDWYANYPILQTSQGKRCYPYLMLRDPKWPLFGKVNLTGRLSYSFDPKQGLRASVGLSWSSGGLRILAMNNLVEASFGLGAF